ncbi:hypothetical protein HPB51_012382 [Rhipicephalus microplus]|uniref:CCHC-type domain-containing protein n=1 Tax=Rhipicephalus microplus TaxID=6941 RepID=A0A9J6DGL9_RHIMP|nr:hypothetical protein HPB51_012382 [Rhipicephalus microplus]
MPPSDSVLINGLRFPDLTMDLDVDALLFLDLDTLLPLDRERFRDLDLPRDAGVGFESFIGAVAAECSLDECRTLALLYNCERLPVRLYKKTVPAYPLCGTVGHRADTCPHPQPGRCTSCGVQVPAATPGGPTEHQCIPSCLLCGGGHKTGAPGCARRFRQPVKSGSLRVSKPRTTGGGGHKQAPTPKTGPKKAPAAKLNKPQPKKTNTGHSTNVKSGTPSEPPVSVKDFPPLTRVQAQVNCWGGTVSGPSPSLSPTETALRQQIGELRRQNQILGCKIQELEAKQVGSSEPVQEAEAEDGGRRLFRHIPPH